MSSNNQNCDKCFYKRNQANILEASKKAYQDLYIKNALLKKELKQYKLFCLFLLVLFVVLSYINLFK